MERTLFCWSSGKDSALALLDVLESRAYEIVALLTTITEDYDRVSMHGVRRVLVESQAEALGLPLEKVFISKNADNAAYEARMGEVLARHQAAGVTSVVFGDIFLEDLRRYREERLAKLGLKAAFPLWKQDTPQLFSRFIQSGLKAVTTCVDTQALGREFVGREIDALFLAELPTTVDPCGENGEYHSFAYDGPIYCRPVPFRLGEKLLRDDRFYYCDLLPESRNGGVGIGD